MIHRRIWIVAASLALALVANVGYTNGGGEMMPIVEPIEDELRGRQVPQQKRHIDRKLPPEPEMEIGEPAPLIDSVKFEQAKLINQSNIESYNIQPAIVEAVEREVKELLAHGEFESFDELEEYVEEDLMKRGFTPGGATNIATDVATAVKLLVEAMCGDDRGLIDCLAPFHDDHYHSAYSIEAHKHPHSHDEDKRHGWRKRNDPRNHFHHHPVPDGRDES